MRIGLFTDTFYPEINGVATSCLTLERELTNLGHEVHVFAPHCKGCEEFAGENIHYIASAPLVVLRDRNMAFPNPIVFHVAENLQFDVVHTNSEFVMGMMGHHVAAKLGCALVHTYHTAWEDYTYYVTHGVADEAARAVVRKYSQWWCDRFSRVIVPTGKTRDLLRRYGVDAPIDVIPSGMDLSRFAPQRHSEEQRKETREACGVKPGERVLLNIGRIAKEKNLEQVMRVFPRLLEQLPDVRFVLVGEGPQVTELKAQAKELGVAGAVTFAGPKHWEEIDRYYAMGDVFVSTSHSETQGLTYIEAMASGMCVCAAKDPCLDGVIEDGESGVLCGDSDDELLEALLRAFSGEGRRIAKNAPACAQPFGREAFARKVEACYLKAISGEA